MIELVLISTIAVCAFAAVAPDVAVSDPPRALLLIEPELLADDAVAQAVDSYRKAVRSRFGYELIVEPMPAATSPEQIRQRLRNLHDDGGLAGVQLVGAYQFARFENAIGERGIFPEYFQDLNGVVEDSDGDEVFDRYDPWVGDGAVLELWLATFRPYAMGPDGANAEEQTAKFFARGSKALKRGRRRPPKRATVFTTKDWRDQQTLTAALESRYGKDVALLGTKERRSSRAQFVDAAKRAGELLFVFAHSGPTVHQLDSPDPPEDQVVPTKPHGAGKRGPLALDELAVRSETVVLWACSILDLDEVEGRDTPILANSYLLGEDSRCRTVLGAARSIGMENLPFLIGELDGADCVFPEAWLAYQNSVYDEDYLSEWLGVRDAWEKERGRFNWSYLIYGDPFARLAR